MKALMWKAVFATMNPSPGFEAVAMFGEELAINGNGLDRNKSALTKRDEHVTATSVNSGRAETKRCLERASTHRIQRAQCR
jgi:hypothetical protein